MQDHIKQVLSAVLSSPGMATVLLIVIYLSFISLGLPDSVLGTAWPLMYLDLGASVSMAGFINTAIALCTVVSSLFSQRLIKRLGTWCVTVISIALTFSALYLFSFSRSMASMLLFSVPLGLGAGTIDTALNNYVAKHYSAMQMNFLHAFWGIGTVIAPSMLSVFFSTGRTWREGYIVLAVIQTVIALIVVLSKPLWKEESGENRTDEMMKQDGRVYSVPQLLRVRGAAFSCLAFTFYTFEGVTILWMASYLVFGKQLDAATAASISSMIYIGISTGRIATAFIANRVSGKWMIQLSQAFIILSIIVLMLTSRLELLYIVVFILGFSFGPVYPAMVKQTVSYFRPEYSVGIISMQMCFNYIGNMFIPPLYGALTSLFGRQDLLPFYLLVLVLLQTACTTAKNRLCGR